MSVDYANGTITRAKRILRSSLVASLEGETSGPLLLLSSPGLLGLRSRPRTIQKQSREEQLFAAREKLTSATECPVAMAQTSFALPLAAQGPRRSTLPASARRPHILRRRVRCSAPDGRRGTRSLRVAF